MRIEFTKMVAAGNDFVVIDSKAGIAESKLKQFAQKVCDRKYGIGADGLLVISKSKKADIRMRIFNADGSEAEMCGNGARCAAFFASQGKKKTLKIDTKAGFLKAEVDKDSVKITMTTPRLIKLNLALAVNQHPLRVNFINTGVPHTVILCDDVSKIKVFEFGRLLRYHRRFQPAGTNVNFIEPKALDVIKVRTYERGVEDETLACGTGSVASAIIYALKLKESGLVKKEDFSIGVDTASGERLQVEFSIKGNSVTNVSLEGKARVICQGVCYAESI